ncbi:ATP-dependent zinc protease family protein [Brumimicrobium aurantiacum]|nr:RimK/LysX family protein [Brumimicrobium aurantiacum]
MNSKAFNQNNKHTIGKVDIAEMPAFELEEVSVKIDSGAYTSTIHCSVIEESEKGLKVVFLDKNEKGYTGKTHYFESYKTKRVRSSSGEMQQRYIIQGDIVLFGEKYDTEFTLSKRDLMRFPVLLGRKLLSNHFIIDTALKNESYKIKNKITK